MQLKPATHGHPPGQYEEDDGVQQQGIEEDG
jgi:hypothetical protein